MNKRKSFAKIKRERSKRTAQDMTRRGLLMRVEQVCIILFRITRP